MSNGRHGPRRSKEWTSILGFDTAFTSDGTSVTAGFTPGQAVTILRMIGEYSIIPLNAPVATEISTITVGIGVVSADAFALGSAAMPDPGGEPEFPWLYWAAHKFQYSNVSTDPSQAGGSVRRSFDIRSMRKMKPRETLAFITQYGQQAGTVDLRISAGQTRVLVAT